MNPSSEIRSKGLAVIASYASSGQIEVTGSARALLEFAEALVTPEPLTERTLTVPSVRTPSPYDGFLQKTRVERNEDKVLITKEEDMLKISGSPQNLRYLAENIRWFASTENDPELSNSSRSHLHVEYHPDHFYLAPASDALIVARENS
jgi:hypothetical protein